MARLRGLFDPFIVALLTVVALASFLPAQGQAARVAAWAANAGIVLLFFLHGAKLSREAIVGGVRNWRLHLLVLAATFVLFPLVGYAVSVLPLLPPTVATGLLFLTLLPSTVQSSIAFTAIARGNVAAAMVSASASNLAGIFLTPLLVAVTIHDTSGTGLSARAAETIALQLLLPFVVGHLLRPLIGRFVTRHKSLLGLVDRGSILIVVYSAFGAAVVEGLWRTLSPAQIGLVALICLAMLALILALTWGLGRVLRLPREDAIVLLFCGTKKSLATGVPMAGVLFPVALVGPILLPVMLFHPFQLIACAVIARLYAGRTADPAAPPAR